MRAFVSVCVVAFLAGCGASPPTPEERAFLNVYKAVMKNTMAEVEWYEKGPRSGSFDSVRQWATQWNSGSKFDEEGDIRLLPTAPKTPRLEQFRDELNKIGGKVDNLRTMAVQQFQAVNEGSPLVAEKIRADGLKEAGELKKSIGQQIAAATAIEKI